MGWEWNFAERIVDVRLKLGNCFIVIGDGMVVGTVILPRDYLLRNRRNPMIFRR